MAGLKMEVVDANDKVRELAAAYSLEAAREKVLRAEYAKIGKDIAAIASAKTKLITEMKGLLNSEASATNRVYTVGDTAIVQLSTNLYVIPLINL